MPLLIIFHITNTWVLLSQFSSVTQSLSCSLQPQGLQHARVPCPSPTPGIYSNSCPLSRWYHSTISPSVIPFSCLQSLPASGSFLMSCSSHQVARVLQLQIQHQSFQCIFRADLPQDWLVWSPLCPRDSQESSPTPQFKSNPTSPFWRRSALGFLWKDWC